MTAEEFTADRLVYLFDFEFSFNLNRAILFMQYGDLRNACRFTERCIFIAYAAGACGLYDSAQIFKIVCTLMESAMHKGAHLCERCLNDE